MKLLKTQKSTLKAEVKNLQKKVPNATTLTPINQHNTEDKQNFLKKKLEMLIKITIYKCFSD